MPVSRASSGLLLVGAGGHARGIVEALALSGHQISAYVDPRRSTWCGARWLTDDADGEISEFSEFVMGVGGDRLEALRQRHDLFVRFHDRVNARVVCHPDAKVSASAQVDPGATILTGAIVCPGARIGRGAIINTAAIIEHDTIIGEGAHVAPGAIVLGGAQIGAMALVGAGSVVLPGAFVAENALVKSLSRFPYGPDREGRAG